MAENSAISWTDHTFNPWIGCTKIGPGCDHCYAEAWDARGLHKGPGRWGLGAERTRTSAANWAKPRAWNRAAERSGVSPWVFCASLADVFDNAVDPAWRADLWRLVVETPALRWIFVTKRIGNAPRMLPADWTSAGFDHCGLVSTVIDQAEADRDVPKLLATPAAWRGLSMEPLLGEVILDAEYLGVLLGKYPFPTLGRIHRTTILDMLDWVIVGGESGPSARPMHPDWARSLRDQCAAANVPFHFKQWGTWVAALDREQDDPDWRADYSGALNDSRPDIAWLNLDGGRGFHGERFHVMRRVGKAKAGRLLDGVEHNGFPRIVPASGPDSLPSAA